MKFLGTLLSLSVGLLAVPAPAEAINVCHDLARDEQRLTCYDEQTGYRPEPVEAESVPAANDPTGPDGSQWRMSEETSSLDGRRDVWLSVPSDNMQPNQIGRPETARLWVRCMNNSTNVFITFNDFTPDNQNVRYRLDDGSVQRIWMVHMQSGEGVGLWSGKSAIPFAKRMFGKDQLVAAYKSYSNLNLEFTFDISGLRQRIDPLASSCQWRP